MKHSSTSNPAKKTINLAIDEELVQAARRLNIDLSSAFEAFLCKELGVQNGPDFCESYAKEISSHSSEAEALMQYCKSNGTF